MSEPRPVFELVDLFAPHPPLRLTRGDEAAYCRFRYLEPALASYGDQTGERGERVSDVLALQEDGHSRGVISYVIETNRFRQSERDQFARIDLVIVETNHRRLGIGRLLILCALTHIIRTYGRRLYSVSCLAAHPAIANILAGLGFTGKPREEKGFTHEELRVGADDLDRLSRAFSEQAAAALRRVHYRLRQGRQQDDAGTIPLQSP